MTAQPVWIIMPVLSNPEMTLAAISDCLAQSVPTRLLIILQGVHGGFRSQIEQLAEEEPRVLVWSHDPPLPSLSASWNRALDFVWACGGTEALVVNNDVRLDPRTVSILQAVLTWPKMGNLFVSAVGVTQEQFDARPDPLFDVPTGDLPIPQLQQIYTDLPKGGPDFSCFLISKVCHEQYRFDEALIPAFLEDLDLHRRMMLNGDGEKIFSINLPFHHVGAGSNTLKSMESAARQRLEHAITHGARAHYRRKWNGDANQERLTIPFDMSTDQDGVTTPDLQRMVQGEPVSIAAPTIDEV